jgi:hypothetical protein
VLDRDAAVYRLEAWLFDLWRCCHQLIICVLHKKIVFWWFRCPRGQEAGAARFWRLMAREAGAVVMAGGFLRMC